MPLLSNEEMDFLEFGKGFASGKPQASSSALPVTDTNELVEDVYPDLDPGMDELPEYSLIAEKSKTWQAPIFYPSWAAPTTGAIVYSGALTPSRENLADVLTADDDANDEDVAHSQATEHDPSQSSQPSQDSGQGKTLLSMTMENL